MLPSPYFLATKIEAFHHRGSGDFLLSRDIEDLVAVLDGRPNIVKEVQAASQDLIRYLADQLLDWINKQAFMDALPGLLPPDAASQARLIIIIERMEAIVACDHED